MQDLEIKLSGSYDPEFTNVVRFAGTSANI